MKWSQLQANLVVSEANRVAGLYWPDGWGYCHRALLHALALLHTYAPFVDRASGAELCGVDPDDLRLNLEDGLVPVQSTWSGISCDNGEQAGITVQGNGRVRPFVGSGGPSAYYFGAIVLCNKSMVNAALADYYFWWARRLYSYGIDTGLKWFGFLGMCAARAGMSEIVEFAATILHEYGHMQGRWHHCGGVDMRYRCCSYTMAEVFRHRVYAELALPMGQVIAENVLDAYSPTFLRGPPSLRGRFDFGSGGAWRAIYTVNGGDPEGCGINWRFAHCDLWTEGHGLEWMSILQAATCVEAGDSLTRHAEYGDGCGGGTSGTSTWDGGFDGPTPDFHPFDQPDVPQDWTGKPEVNE